MSRRLLAASLGLAIGVWFAPSATAASVTLGQVAPPGGFSGSCGACSDVQFSTDPASPSYAVPGLPAGGGPWTVTSWSFRGGDGGTTPTSRLLVWRRTATPG